MKLSAFSDAVGWFPPECAHEFYLIKGLLALAATVAYVVHMTRSWSLLRTIGQQLRYLTLLAFAAVVTFASVEQVTQDAVVNYRNIGAMAATGLLLVAALVSIREDRRR